MKRGINMFGMLGVATLLVVSSLSGEAHAQSAAKIADCRIESAGKVQFDGRCRFSFVGDGGSFSLANTSGQGPLYGSVLTVNVILLGPTVAEVRGLTKAGINSRWGQARRSKTDRACWAGSDFKVCAR